MSPSLISKIYILIFKGTDECQYINLIYLYVNYFHLIPSYKKKSKWKENTHKTQSQGTNIFKVTRKKKDQREY